MRRSPPSAGAGAHVTGRLAVCAGSCGSGNLHLINGLFDCHRSRLPVVAIAAHILFYEIGCGYFQETLPAAAVPGVQQLLRIGLQPGAMPHVLEIAIRRAIAEGCLCVVVVPGNVALLPTVAGGAPRCCCRGRP